MLCFNPVSQVVESCSTAIYEEKCAVTPSLNGSAFAIAISAGDHVAVILDNDAHEPVLVLLPRLLMGKYCPLLPSRSFYNYFKLAPDGLLALNIGGHRGSAALMRRICLLL